MLHSLFYVSIPVMIEIIRFLESLPVMPQRSAVSITFRQFRNEYFATESSGFNGIQKFGDGLA